MSLEPIITTPLGDAKSRPHITVRPEPHSPDSSQPRFELRKPIQKATLGDDKASWGGDGFDAADAIDLVNPLQHIPIVGHIYRAVTGDTISNEASIIGGTIFSGAIGLAFAGAGALIAQEADDKPKTQTIAARSDATNVPSQDVAQMVRRPLITVPATLPPAPEETAESIEKTTPDVPYTIPRAAITSPQSAPTQPILEALRPVPAPSNPAPSKADKPPLPLTLEDAQKHDAILELFGSGVSLIGEEYRKTQQLAQLHQTLAALTV